MNYLVNQKNTFTSFDQGITKRYCRFMKIYIAHASNYDYKKELYEPLKQSSFSKEHTLILPHDGDAIHSKQAIGTCDVIVAEVSFPSTGLGIELGWADDQGKKIICIHKKTATPSSSLSFITQYITSYSTPDTIPDLLQSLI